MNSLHSELEKSMNKFIYVESNNVIYEGELIAIHAMLDNHEYILLNGVEKIYMLMR